MKVKNEEITTPGSCHRGSSPVSTPDTGSVKSRRPSIVSSLKKMFKRKTDVPGGSNERLTTPPTPSDENEKFSLTPVQQRYLKSSESLLPVRKVLEACGMNSDQVSRTIRRNRLYSIRKLCNLTEEDWKTILKTDETLDLGVYELILGFQLWHEEFQDEEVVKDPVNLCQAVDDGILDRLVATFAELRHLADQGFLSRF